MKIIDKKIKLNNGVEIPVIAIGTWQIPNDVVKDVIKYAYDAGYRHIDTAIQYYNEEGIGTSIRDNKINREELFITTKIPSDTKNYEDTLKEIDASLKRLKTDYLDLVLIHAPRPWPEMHTCNYRYLKENVEVYKALEKAYHDKKIRAIGVSNFDVVDLQNILDNCEIVPQVNQIQVNIGYTQFDILDFCKKHNIQVEAYAPNATGRLLNNEKAAIMAKKYGVSVPQLCIRYCIELGLVVLPKSVHKDHIIENTNVDFKISDDDMQTLKEMAKVVY